MVLLSAHLSLADPAQSAGFVSTYVLMLQVLQELQFTIRSFRQDRRAEGFHDLLDRNILSCELILGRAVREEGMISTYSSYNRLCGMLRKNRPRDVGSVVAGGGERTRRDRKLPYQLVANPST